MRVWVLATVLLLGVLGANGGGCQPDPNHIGVQDYGAVTGRVIDAKTNQPVNGALVVVGTIVNATTDAQGAFTLEKIPVGTQTVRVSAAGYVTSSVDAKIKKDQTTQLDYIKLSTLP